MKKRFTICMMAITLFFSGVMGVPVKAQEQTLEDRKSFSFLVDDSLALTDSGVSPLGVYLIEGMCVISDKGNGKIAVGGTTIAAKNCRISVNVVLEKRSTNSQWTRVKSWSDTQTYDDYAGVSKYYYVESGYYYRVWATHTANYDTSSTQTDGIWISY